MQELSFILKAHVRKEARIIFPMIKKALPEEVLQEMVPYLQIFRTGKPIVFRRGMKVRANMEWYKKRRFVPLRI
ncbi:hypothetical protein [Pseudogracilibacillus sp. SO30301A]|uniref:hypothetical protein n=1 Tax=Pseudogracilibacillus sp. SO30301A TaxID=3098291 RepID=UPI00300DF080